MSTVTIVGLIGIFVVIPAIVIWGEIKNRRKEAKESLKSLQVKKSTKNKPKAKRTVKPEGRKRKDIKSESDKDQTVASGRNKDIEDFLKRSFELQFVSERDWAYKGSAYKLDLPDRPDLFVAAIKELQTEIGYTQVCIVIGTPTLVVFNTKPSFGMFTSLKVSAKAELIDSLIKANGKQVYAYKGVLVFTL